MNSNNKNHLARRSEPIFPEVDAAIDPMKSLHIKSVENLRPSKRSVLYSRCLASDMPMAGTCGKEAVGWRICHSPQECVNTVDL